MALAATLQRAAPPESTAGPVRAPEAIATASLAATAAAVLATREPSRWSRRGSDVGSTRALLHRSGKCASKSSRASVRIAFSAAIDPPTATHRPDALTR